MRYIKGFNESVSKEVLTEFCNKYLIYIIDNGFQVRVTTVDSENIFIEKGFKNFKFEEIKSDIIPFFIILNQEYDINPYVWVKYSNDSVRTYNIDDMDNQDLNSKYITYLRFILKKSN